LARAGGAIKVGNAAEMETTLDALLVAPGEAAQLAQAASKALEQLRTSKAATAAFWSALEAAIQSRKRP
jgi:hypothetical protein